MPLPAKEAAMHPEGQIVTRPVTKGKVVSHTPGRTRLRLDRDSRHSEIFARAQQTLASFPSVQVETNPLTGSILLQYEPQKVDIHALLRTLAQLHALHIEFEGQGIKARAEEDLPSRLFRIVDAVDRWIFKVTGFHVDLRFLVPAGLGAAGIALAVYQGGIGLGEVQPLLVLLLAVESLFQLYEYRKIQALRAAGLPEGRAPRPLLTAP
jgi:hypothetical protein